MTISPPVVEQAGRRGVARRRFPRRWGEFDEPRLEFVGPDAPQLDADPDVAPDAVEELGAHRGPEVDQPTDHVDAEAAASSEERDASADTASGAPQRADLEVLLKPKGRLLSRAFDLTGDQHSVLTGASGVDVEQPSDASEDASTDSRADQADAS